MHSTFFVISTDPVTEEYEIEENEAWYNRLTGRGYDYWDRTLLDSEVENYLSGGYSDFLKTERIYIENADYPEDSFLQYKMTITNRDIFMKKLYDRYRKAVDELSEYLTLKRLSDSADHEISMLRYRIDCILDDAFSMQFYSDYTDFESPERLIRRSKDGDVYYIIAAYDFHY